MNDIPIAQSTTEQCTHTTTPPPRSGQLLTPPKTIHPLNQAIEMLASQFETSAVPSIHAPHSYSSRLGLDGATTVCSRPSEPAQLDIITVISVKKANFMRSGIDNPTHTCSQRARVNEYYARGVPLSCPRQGVEAWSLAHDGALTRADSASGGSAGDCDGGTMRR